MRLLLRLVFLLLLPPAIVATPAQAAEAGGLQFARKTLPALPAGLSALGAHGGVLIGLAGHTAFVLPDDTAAWRSAGNWSAPGASGILATTSTDNGVVVLTAGRTLLLQWSAGTLTTTELPPPPRRLESTALGALGKTLYLADGTDFWSLDLTGMKPGWTALPPPPANVRAGDMLAGQLEQVTLFTADATYAYLASSGWKRAALSPPPFEFRGVPGAIYGAAHVFFFDVDATHAYHVATDTWIDYAPALTDGSRPRLAAARSGKAIVLDDASCTQIEALPLPTGYSWIDHSVVAVYLLAMVAMSLWFARGNQNSNDYFRAGNRIPWWASGMSLFATFASAITMMSMPSKAFSSDWTYFSLSIFALIALPISLFLLTPLVRRLKIPTANAYLERRFGLATRMLASSIAIFTTSIARQGSVLVIPAIALSTVMGVDVITSIVVMGLVTLAYTFFGGLTAVVWTDTVQGFIMIGSAVVCLVLAWLRIDMPPGEAWSLLRSTDKLNVFDWDWSIAYPSAWIFLLTTVIITVGNVGSQDFIQRVQCTPDLKQARLAVATQLLVAVPLNLVFFALGTVLFLFYHQHPAAISPAMKIDGIFPFFVAQQLPAGVPGLVVAALLAATMSTISSCNCSVSDLITQDFYRRFHPAAPDRTLLRFGRVTTLISGLVGIATAIWMAKATLGSMWDLAMLVTNLISNGIVGLFTLGLFTRRAHQTGALIGVITGMVAVWWLQQNGAVTFWLYNVIGTLITVVVGYVASLLLPGRVPDLAGLTVFSLKEKPGSADASP